MANNFIEPITVFLIYISFVIFFHYLYKDKKANIIPIIYSIIFWIFAFIYILCILFTFIIPKRGNFPEENIVLFQKISDYLFTAYMIFSNLITQFPDQYLSDGHFKWYQKFYSVFTFIITLLVVVVIAALFLKDIQPIIFPLVGLPSVYYFFFGLAEGISNIPQQFLIKRK